MKPMVIAITFAAGLMLSGCATSDDQTPKSMTNTKEVDAPRNSFTDKDKPLPSPSMASQRAGLRNDAEKILSVLASPCQDLKVIRIESDESKPTADGARRTIERWTIDQCGTNTTYALQFTQRGTDISVGFSLFSFGGEIRK